MACLLLLVGAAQEALAPALGELDALDREAFENARAAVAMQRARALFAANPTSYDAAWRVARAAFKQAYTSQDTALKLALGQEGYQASQRALALRPDGVEALYWGSCALGEYGQSAGILQAVMDGVAGKIQKGFERAIQIDRSYNEAGPLEALGRYWYTLPWPMRDHARALALLEEGARIAPHKLRLQAYLGDSYLALERRDDARRAYERCARAELRREIEVDAAIWQAHCTTALGAWTKGP